MFGVETIGKVRLALTRGESIHSIAKKYRMSRNTVRKMAHRVFAFMVATRVLRCDISDKT